jgi:hypothetical protein
LATGVTTPEEVGRIVRGTEGPLSKPWAEALGASSRELRSGSALVTPATPVRNRSGVAGLDTDGFRLAITRVEPARREGSAGGPGTDVVGVIVDASRG